VVNSSPQTLSLNEIRTVGELVATYQPLNSEQGDYFSSPADIRWLFGGNQSGKSFNNMMDLAMVLLDVHPYRYRPAGMHWAAIESWEQVRDILWAEYLEKMIPSQHILDIKYGQERVPRKILLRSGHILEFKAFNQGRELFQGRAIDSCHCDEQCHHDLNGIFNEMQARLMKLKGYLSWSMTPIVPQPFLEERLEELPETDEAFYLDLNDNRKSKGGYIDDGRVNDLISEWPEETQATRIKGMFASFYGAVFKSFNRRIHIIPPFDIPSEWRRYRGIDFGFTNPFVCLWLALDKDENWYIYQEYYRAKTGIDEHIFNIKKLSGSDIYVATWADPENAGDRNELHKAGIPTKPARKDIAKGIELVQSKLKVKDNGKPSLFIFSSCRNISRELALYHYPKGTSTRNPKDIPEQVNDHTVDALRYTIYSTCRPGAKGRVTC